MRRSTRNAFLSGSLLLLSACAPAGQRSPGDGPFAQAHAPIVFGTSDSGHTAVVALLADGGNGSFSECSGTIVQVSGGTAYVLTAAHCCGGDPQAPGITPSLVIMDSDYAPYEQYIGNASPPAPSYAVTAGSVQWDQAYNGMDHDFCMLQFAGADASTPVIPVPQSASDGLSVGVSVEYVGFGVTSGNGNGNNSRRNHATSSVDQQVTSLVIQYSEGQGIGGPCEGDSGGPALLPAGAPQAQQTVVATTSYGDQTCVQYGVSSRVSSEIGPGGFIGKYLSAGNQGSGGGGNQPSCTTCAQGSVAQGGACSGALATCQNDPSCNAILACMNGCAAGDATCSNNCYAANAAGQAGYDAIDACICSQACPQACAAQCGQGSSAASTGSGNASGSTGSGNASGSTGSGNASGSTGSGNASGSTGSGNGSGSTGSGNASGSTGSGNAGAGGATGAGTGSGNGSGSGTGGYGGTGGSSDYAMTTKTGCSAASGAPAPGSTGALGGLLLGAAFAFSRRGFGRRPAAPRARRRAR